MKVINTAGSPIVKFRETEGIANIMKRPYTLKQRAADRDRTRQRIVEAAIELHQAKGLAATSVSDIAERAQVGKVTVYRHFPDDADLLAACSGQYFQRHPFPNPDDWQEISDASERLRHGLRETYAYHRATEPMIARVMAETCDLPLMEPYHMHWRHAADMLASAWPESRRTALLKAALALALSFDTWRQLVRAQGLTDDQAIALMMRLVEDRKPYDG